MNLEYKSIENALNCVNSPYAPEDSHGMLCALLIVNNSLQYKRWLDEICSPPLPSAQISVEHQNILRSLYDHTRQELNDTLLNFKLLVPEDDLNLRERVQALKKWCDGFLFGLALGGIKDVSGLPEDSYEVLQDIVKILQVSEEDEEDDELNEVAYLDIIEYVRMGVLLINEELQPMNRPVTIQ